MCAVLEVFAWVVKCRSMILLSVNVNGILQGNQHASEIVISAYFPIPPNKMERAFVTHVFCELVFCPCVLGISYSVVWVTVWALRVAVIPPLNGIPLFMTLA